MIKKNHLKKKNLKKLVFNFFLFILCTILNIYKKNKKQIDRMTRLCVAKISHFFKYRNNM